MVEKLVIDGIEIPPKKFYKKTNIPYPANTSEYNRIYYHIRTKQKRMIEKLEKVGMMVG